MNKQQFDAWLNDPMRSPLVMGVLNVTPDSFSDGGRFAGVDAAVAQAEQMALAGADIIDIGGETTKPGSHPVPPEEQIRRIVPVLNALGTRLPVIYSVDTTRANVAAAALDAGACIVNDISAGRDDPEMLPLIARRRVPVILMHMLGTPSTMQIAPSYRHVTAEVVAFLNERTEAAKLAGISSSNILLDPGLGFGKTVEHNLELLRFVNELVRGGHPIVIGASRKRFIGTITGESEPERRIFGTAAVIAWSITNGAAIMRVHDVGPMVQVVKMIQAIQNVK